MVMSKKIVSNFFDKRKYVLHYENLQLYLRLGLKLKKILHVLEFNQSQWLDYCTKKNRNRKNNDKDGKVLCKLLNNFTYGKTMETWRNRINVKLVNNEKDYLKCTSKPSYMSNNISGNKLVVIQKSKVALNLNKPAYSGTCILELSKVLMYKFHYCY